MAIVWDLFGKCIARSHGVYGKDELLLIGSMGLGAKICSLDCSFLLDAEGKARKCCHSLRS